MSLTDQKVDEAITELREWLEKSGRKEEEYDKNIKEIDDYLNEEVVRKSILNRFEYLDNWYSNNFIFELLTEKDTNIKLEACSNEFLLLLVANKLADTYPKNPPSLLFDKVAYWLANCVSQKWYHESTILIDIINKGLNSKLLNGGLAFKSTSWFIITIVNKILGDKTIDYSTYNYPKEMSVYKEVLDNWNTQNMELLDTIISKMCDFHLENAIYGTEEDTADIQFGKDIWFVYAFEILTWLNIREKAGLSNPEKYTHPLMNLEINKPTKTVHPMPQGDLYKRVSLKLSL